MATAPSEGKAETKPESKPEANKEKEAGENQEQLKCKTWVLRVSIHCEGCKRKVHKILTNIDGVYTTKIDLRQHKVVVKGDVAAETLIRKLEKNGKHAELWPESKAEQKEKKQSKGKNKEKQQQQQQQQQQQGDQESSDEGNKNPAEKETVKEPSKSKENGNGGAGTSKNVENNGAVHHVIKVNEVGAQVAKESKPDQVKQTVTFAADGQSPVGDKKAGDTESEGGVEKSGGGGGGGGGGKKKKKKGHKGNNGNNNVVIGGGEPFGGVGGDARAGTGSPMYGPHGPTHAPFPFPASYSPPRQHGYPYAQYAPPPHYYTPPVYATSYNTAHPRPSNTTSYYAPPTPHSYAYMHPGTGCEIPPSDVDSYSSQPSDSFEIFSDENPNACAIM